jgi:hypothetical protein
LLSVGFGTSSAARPGRLADTFYPAKIVIESSKLSCFWKTAKMLISKENNSNKKE